MRTPGSGYHCSALVRVAPDGKDVFFGHDTWDTYASMVRCRRRRMPIQHTIYRLWNC